MKGVIRSQAALGNGIEVTVYMEGGHVVTLHVPRSRACEFPVHQKVEITIEQRNEA